MERNEYLRQIQIFKNNKQFNEALELAQKAVHTYNDNCFRNEMYECYKVLGKYNEAVKILKEMIKTEPENLSIQKKLAYVYYLLSKFKEAVEYFKNVLLYEPLSSVNYYNVASMYHYMKNYDLAKIYYSAAIKLDNKNLSAINNTGVLFLELGNWKKSFEFFNYSLFCSKNNPEAFHYMGVIYRDYCKDYELSELYLKKAVDLDKNYADNYYQLALTYAKRIKPADTILALKMCLELNPKHTNALKLLTEMNVPVKKK